MKPATVPTILNLTGAPSCLALRKLGVFDPSALDAKKIQDLLGGEQAKLLGPGTKAVAEDLAEIAAASCVSYALIDPPPYLVSVLEQELRKLEIKPVYADGRLKMVMDPESRKATRVEFVVVRLLGL